MASSFIGVDGFALSHHVHNCNAKLENDWVFVRITKINHTVKVKKNLRYHIFQTVIRYILEHTEQLLVTRQFETWAFKYM